MPGKIRKSYLLSLYRRKITPQADSAETEQREKTFFCTDYFDQLCIEEIEGNADLSVFIGAKNQEKSLKDVISAQYYSIYQSQKQKSDDLSCLFAPNDEYNFLSLIHIYITPEVLGALDSDYENYMELFAADLQKVLDECTSCLDSIRGELFDMMSGGDFMMVIRSKTPEDAYAVSTQIRRRLITKKQNQSESLTAFKTYTMLLFGNEMQACAGKRTGSVVIRGRYSNLYWKKVGDNDPFLEFPQNAKHLNGRYDFTVDLTVEEFNHIYKKIRNEKFREEKAASKKCSEDKADSYTDKEQYLFMLLENGYVSYVNERYLIENKKNLKELVQKLNKKINRKIGGIYLNENYDFQYGLTRQINEKCDKLLKEIDEQENQWMYLNQKEIKDSYRMFRRLVYLCQTANTLSDTRIYVISLIEQLNTVLDSAHLWLNLYQEYHSEKLLKFFMVYTRQALVDLESYGSMIRNDNLQTLQAPSYRITTGCSTEKILTAYGRLLNSMMTFCCEELELGCEKNYLSVVVPKLDKDSLEVEVLFPKWFYEDGEQDENEQKLLLVARGPVTGELLEPARMITALFHEMAHQLRYEPREKRNPVLAELFLESVSDVIVRFIFDHMENGEMDLDVTNSMKTMLSDILVEALKNSLEISTRYNADSLERFKERIQNDLNQFLQDLQSNEREIQCYIQKFVEDTNEYMDLSRANELIKMVDLADSLEQIEDKGLSPEAKKDYEKQLKKDLADCINKYILGCKEDLDDEIFLDMQKMGNSLIVKIAAYQPQLTSKRKERKEKFLSKFYKESCLNWNKILEAEGDLKSESTFIPSLKAWVRLGRKLAIDYNTKDNNVHFNRIVIDAVKGLEFYRFSEGMRPIELYREETSDLFMCEMCDLDFKSYIAYCAEAFPSVNMVFQPGHIERIADIIIILWGIDDEKLMSNPINYEYLFEWINSASRFGGLLEALTGGHSSNINEMLMQFKEIIQEQNGGRYLEKQKYMAALAIQVIECMADRVDWLTTRAYLMEDFKRGIKRYCALKQRFYNEAQNEFDINNIAKICRANKAFLGLIGGDENEEITEYRVTCREFLLKMHSYDRFYCVRDFYVNKSVESQQPGAVL